MQPLWRIGNRRVWKRKAAEGMLMAGKATLGEMRREGHGWGKLWNGSKVYFLEAIRLGTNSFI
jgi:hypothetical protein